MGSNRNRFTPEEDAYIIQNIHRTYKELSDDLYNIFGSNHSWESISGRCKRTLMVGKKSPPYTDEEVEYMMLNVSSMKYRDMAKELTKISGIYRTESGVSTYCKRNRFDHRDSHYYTDEEMKWLKENAPYHLIDETTSLFNEKFGRDKSTIAIKSYTVSHGIRIADGVIKDGYVERGKKREKIGRVYTDAKGNKKIKRKSGEDVIPMTHHVWEIHNGKIPGGHMIVHLDGDRANNDIENLACVPKKYHTTLNKHLRTESNNPELMRTKIKYCELKEAIKGGGRICQKN